MGIQKDIKGHPKMIAQRLYIFFRVLYKYTIQQIQFGSMEIRVESNCKCPKHKGYIKMALRQSLSDHARNRWRICRASSGR